MTSSLQVKHKHLAEQRDHGTMKHTLHLASNFSSSSSLVSVHVHVLFLSAFRSTIQYSIYLYSSLLSTYFIVLHIPLPLFLSLFYFCTGTAIRESVDILNAAGAILVAVAVSLDRQEKATDTATESAIQVRHRRISERKGKEGREGMSLC